MNMIQTSIFVPLLHKDTPRPLKIPQSTEKLIDKNCFLPNPALVKEFLMTREYIMKEQENIEIKQRIEEELAKDRHMMVQEVLEQASFQDNSVFSPSKLNLMETGSSVQQALNRGLQSKEMSMFTDDELYKPILNHNEYSYLAQSAIKKTDLKSSA